MEEVKIRAILLYLKVYSSVRVER